MLIKLLTEGGEMKPGPALSQKLGPVGISINQVIQKVNEATKGFTGMKVPVELDVNPSTKEFSIKVFSPPVSELIKKELGIAKGSGEQKKMKAHNASIEQIISVAKAKHSNLLDKDLKAAVKTVLGSSVSLGILVESKNPQEITADVNSGKYDSEISKEKTETSEEKRNILDDFFAKIKVEQDKVLKLRQEAAKVAEEKEEKKSPQNTSQKDSPAKPAGKKK